MTKTTMSLNEWIKYRDILSKINEKAADTFRDAVFNINGRWKGVGLGEIPRDELIDYAYALATKYGEASAAAAAEMFEKTALAQNASAFEVLPAETASYHDVAKTVNGVLKRSQNVNEMAGAVSRLVKQAGCDTTLQNAYRYNKKYGKKKNTGAQVAWIPSGDTCPFCLMLASNGWRNETVKGAEDHADHVHANCDCAYMVRFNTSFSVGGYDPDDYKEMFDNAEGDTWNEKINFMRRANYEKNKDKINAQKRAAYAERIGTKQDDKNVLKTHVYDQIRNRISIEPVDVTDEYRKRATPGIGAFVKENGFEDIYGEEAIAVWIHDTFGGDLKLLAANNPDGEKNPDYLWRDHLWDLKTISTEKAANSAIRSGLKQIRKNVGGVILSLKDDSIMNSELYDVINERMKWCKLEQVDIMLKHGNQYSVLRYTN